MRDFSDFKASIKNSEAYLGLALLKTILPSHYSFFINSTAVCLVDWGQWNSTDKFHVLNFVGFLLDSSFQFILIHTGSRRMGNTAITQAVSS